MWQIEITVDTNDADYNTSVGKISQEDLDLITPLIVEIRDSKADYNFPNSEYVNESAIDMYPDYEGAVGILEDLCPYGENGFHSIENIRIYKVSDVQTLLGC